MKTETFIKYAAVATGLAASLSLIMVTPAHAAGVAPTVSITAPAAGATYSAPATVNVAASAADSDGKVQFVDFFVAGPNGTSQIGHDTTAPYTAQVQGLPAGNYNIYAVAVDNTWTSTKSASVGIVVNPAQSGSAFLAQTQPASATVSSTGVLTLNVPVENVGTGAASNVTVKTVTSVNGCTGAANTLTAPALPASLGTIEAGKSATFTATFKAAGPACNYVNYTVSGTYVTGGQTRPFQFSGSAQIAPAK